MKRISPEIKRCFERHHTVIISSVGVHGIPHTSVKGLLQILRSGVVRLADLYDGVTRRNIKKNPNVALTVIDVPRFKGYCLKGKARALAPGRFSKRDHRCWEKRLTTRIADRILRNIREQKKAHPGHPEAELPKPIYVIEIKVDEIVDLAQHS